MLIGIDGNEANVDDRVGINVYAYEILWALYKLVKEHRQKHRLIVYLRTSPHNDLPPEGKWLRYKVLPGKTLWILAKLTPSLYLERTERPGVFFTPGHYLPPVFTIPLVCSIMDLGYLEFSGQFTKYDFWQLKLWTAISVYISKYIISISQSTKDHIVRRYPSASKKTVVTYLAFDKSIYNRANLSSDVRRTLKKYLIVGKYILFISTLKPSKNIEGLLTAWQTVADKIKNVKLVIAGKKGWLFTKIFDQVKSRQIADSVIFTGFLPEKDKPMLIKGAQALILPSFWEGFGLDPLYAMASGTPVIVSKIGSLPEVVGDAGIYIDPYDHATISTALVSLLTMSEIGYNKLKAKGLAQSERFSWETTAVKTLDVLERAAGK